MKTIIHARDKTFPGNFPFDPDKLEWRSKNYGQFCPSPVRVEGDGEDCFVKRLPDMPASWRFLSEHCAEPCSKRLPRVRALVEDAGRGQGFRYYLFYERLDGVTLDELRGKLTQGHCAGILDGVGGALRAITSRGFWHCDLEFGNVFLGQGKAGFATRLVDIDSAVPLNIPFKRFLGDSRRRPNVHEKYWGYLLLRLNAERLEKLSGVSVSQAAFMYFAMDLFFFVKRPGSVMPLRAGELDRLMRSPGATHVPVAAKRAWETAHRAIVADPWTGAPWGDVARFVNLLFPVSHSGAKTVAPLFGGFGSFVSRIFGGSAPTRVLNKRPDL
jgi:hypothetical protein